MIDIKTEIIINLPKEIVAEFVSDPNNAARWCKHIKSVEWEAHGRLRAGAKLVLNKHVYQVIEVIPGQKITMHTLSNGVNMETTIAWQAINEYSTCMTLRNRGIPHSFSKAIAPLLALVIRKLSRRNLKRLKNLLEYSNRRMAVL
jgi:uncharacterized membrane protein